MDDEEKNVEENHDSEEEENVEEEEEEEESEEDDDDAARERAKSQIDRLKEENRNLKEKLGSEGEEPEDDPKDDSIQLSPKDYLFLSNQGVNEEDLDDIIEYATFKKISIREALKSSTVKTILAENEEKRKTADATNARKGRSTAKKKTPAQVLKETNEGNIPEPGSQEAEDLFWAKRGGRPKS